MAGADDHVEVGFEEGMSWLPSHVLDEAIRDTRKDHVKQQPYHRHRPKLPSEPQPLHSKSSSRPNHRPKYPTSWASGGPGMQAFFLVSGKRPCGTGVFLPQRAGTNFQPSRKPACSPVLLPCRVVQALNLNVHALGLQISPRKDARNSNSRGGVDCNSIKNKSSNKEVPNKCCAISQNQSPPPDVFLPKEWTY